MDTFPCCTFSFQNTGNILHSFSHIFSTKTLLYFLLHLSTISLFKNLFFDKKQTNIHTIAPMYITNYSTQYSTKKLLIIISKTQTPFVLETSILLPTGPRSTFTFAKPVVPLPILQYHPNSTRLKWLRHRNLKSKNLFNQPNQKSTVLRLQFSTQWPIKCRWKSTKETLLFQPAAPF